MKFTKTYHRLLRGVTYKTIVVLSSLMLFSIIVEAQNEVPVVLSAKRWRNSNLPDATGRFFDGLWRGDSISIDVILAPTRIDQIQIQNYVIEFCMMGTIVPGVVVSGSRALGTYGESGLIKIGEYLRFTGAETYKRFSTERENRVRFGAREDLERNDGTILQEVEKDGTTYRFLWNSNGHIPNHVNGSFLMGFGFFRSDGEPTTMSNEPSSLPPGMARRIKIGSFSFSCIRDLEYKGVVFTPFVEIRNRDSRIYLTHKWGASINFFDPQTTSQEISSDVQALKDSIGVMSWRIIELSKRLNHLQQGDFNIDSIVNFADFLIFVENFGKPVN